MVFIQVIVIVMIVMIVMLVMLVIMVIMVIKARIVKKNTILYNLYSSILKGQIDQYSGRELKMFCLE